MTPLGLAEYQFIGNPTYNPISHSQVYQISYFNCRLRYQSYFVGLQS